MNETDMVVVGDPLPTIASVEKGNGPFDIVVTWASGARAGETDVIDVAPQVFTFKVYRPLRDDPESFARVEVGPGRRTIVWPGNPDLEIGADVLQELAEQVMTSSDFADFIKARGWTLDATAAQLGISRRLVAYYAKEREVPRYIALACHALMQSDSHKEAEAIHAPRHSSSRHGEGKSGLRG